MPPSGRPLDLALVPVLMLWVLGLFWIPESAWLAPFVRLDHSSDNAVSAGTAEDRDFVVPGRRGQRPGRRHLGHFDREPNASTVLRLTVGESQGLGLLIKDSGSGSVLRRMRLASGSTTSRHWIVLKPRPESGRIGLTLWNRSRDSVVVRSVEIVPLAPGYRIPRSLYRLLGLAILLAWVVVRRQSIRNYLFSPEPGGRETPGERSRDRLAALLLFVLCFLIFRSAPVHQLLDGKYLSVVSHAVLTTGSVALPDNFGRAARPERSYTLRRVGDSVYHSFSSAPAVLGVPFVAAFESVGISPVSPEGRYLGHHEMRILRFTAAFLAASTCSVLLLLARIWLAPFPAILLTLVFAFGTPMYSVVSRPYWSHAWAVLLLTGALYLLADPRFRDRSTSYAGIATLLSWAYFCRPTMSLAVIGVTLYLWLDRRPRLICFLATGFVWLLALVVYSLACFGTLLPPYLLSSHLDSGRLGAEVVLASYPEALLGTLVSPGRGLFIYLPFLVLVAIVSVRDWPWLPDRRLAVTAIGVCVAHWQVVSLFRNWWGGQSFGPRLMSDLIPWFFLLSVFVVWTSLGPTRARSPGRRRWLTATTVVTVVLACWIHGRGAWVQDTQRGAGLWNWRYPQFLAGILERPGGEEDRGSQ